MIPRKQILLFLIAGLFACQTSLQDRIPAAYREAVLQALEKSENNRAELEKFLQSRPDEQIEAAAFLIAYMPERDLKSLSAKFLSEQTDFAFKARKETAWGKDIPDSLFLNYVLPYANIHERRDNWRKNFYEKFLPLVKDVKSPGEAVVILNNKIWDIVGVRYSTKRPKADQSPYESMEAGLASCTGLSILLTDACRAVGIPARFVGVPLWYDNSGNHSWVEIWDNGWHFIGAGEQGPLDETWFKERAAHANNSDWKYRIYAVSYKKTGISFPDLFDPNVDYLWAVNVTGRYAQNSGSRQNVELRIMVFDEQRKKRIPAKVKLLDGDKVIEEGFSRGEQNDMNDVLTFDVLPDHSYMIVVDYKGKEFKREVRTGKDAILEAEISVSEQ
ncbi:MAG: transglutaminase domain-containing protein [Calditrichaeota bacterium]|nr:transglutaminase domain-containing protein [Calditrichota bacterium]